MSDQYDKQDPTLAPLAPLFDSTEGCRIQISAELVAQLANNAKFVADRLHAGATGLVTVVVQVDKASGKTIKPTMTFEDGRTGVFGVVILEIEPPKPKS